MKIKTILYTTLLCSTVFCAEPFDPNALTGSNRDKIAQLSTYLKSNGCEVSHGESVNSLIQKANNFIALRNQGAANTQAFTQQIADLTGEKDYFQTKAARSKAKKRALRDELTASSTQQAQVTADAQALAQQIATLTGERDTARVEKDRLEAQLAALQTQQGQVAGDAQALAQQITALKAEKNWIKDEKEQLEIQLDALQTQQAQATANAQALEQQIAVLKAERDAARTEKDQLETELADLQTQQDQLREVLGRLNTYTSRIAELEQDLATRQHLSQELEEAYRQEQQSQAERISELEMRHQGDILLIVQLQEQLRVLQEDQQAGFSVPTEVPEQRASENTHQPPLGGPPPPPPPPPASSEDQTDKPKRTSKKEASSAPQASGGAPQRPSAGDITSVRLKPKDEQEPLAERQVPQLEGRGALLDQIRTGVSRKQKSPLSIDDQRKLITVKAEIIDGKYVSIFWKPEENALAPENTSSEPTSMLNLLKKAMGGRRADFTESDDDTSSDNSDWSDSDDDATSPATSHQPAVPKEVLTQLSTIRQIYREALNIGYEDDAKEIKWGTERWLLWEYDFYKTSRQRSSVDAKIETYIKEHFDDLQGRYSNVDFESIVHKDGAPMAPHSTEAGEDPLLQSVVFPSAK